METVRDTGSDSSGHGLLCPTCRVDLIMGEREGIEIDYCRKCRGVWLDRAELDKIIERSARDEASSSQTQQPGPAQSLPSQNHDDRGHGSGHGGDHGYRRRHGSFFGRIFD